MERKAFRYQNKTIYYRLNGNGPLVVLLHGFGEDATIWQRQFDIFPNHRLIIPDLPGSGGSEIIDDMSMEGLADVVHALLQEEWAAGGERGCVLIGHSMGGYITLAFAEKYPEVLNAFGLFHSSAFADSEEKKESRRKGIAFIKKAGAFEFLKTSTPNMYSPKTKEESPGLIEEHLASVRNFSAEALVLYYEAMMQRPDRTGVLRNSAVPVFFVMGRHDNAVPLEDALKQCHLPPLSYIHLLENSGHTGMKEEPETANQLLTGFVSMLETVATV